MVTSHLSIAKPCNQNWDGMIPADKGRHCAACNKTVTDFTNCTDEELIAQLSIKRENECGRFYKHQLTIQLSQKESPYSLLSRKLKLIAVSIGALLGIKTIAPQQANAQTIDVDGGYCNKSSIAFSKIKSDDPSKINIAGLLKDKETNESIPFANIEIKSDDTHLGYAETDDNGNFILTFGKEELLFEKIDILISYLGYEPMKILNIPVENSSLYLNLSMTGNTLVMGEVVIGYIHRPMVDLNQTSTGSVLTKDEIKHLPK